MDLFQLQCFDSVAKNESFTLASKELAISQSALSKQISKLEMEVHATLFDRSKHRISLTEAGKIFALHNSQILQDYSQLKKAMNEHSPANELRLILTDGIINHGLSKPLISFLNIHYDNQLRVTIKTRHTNRALSDLLEGRADVAITSELLSPYLIPLERSSGYPNSIRKVKWCEDQFYAIMPKHHPLSTHKTITWKEYISNRLIHLNHVFFDEYMISDEFYAQGYRPNVAIECDRFDTMLDLVASDVGISMSPKCLIKEDPRIVMVPFTDPVRINIYLNTIPNNDPDNLVGKFVRHLLDYQKRNDSK